MNQSEMRTLGRIGQPLSGGTYRPRRRLRAPRWLLGVLGVALLAVLWLGISANRQVGAEPQQVAAGSAVPARPDAAANVSRSARSGHQATFASVDGLPLTLPHTNPLQVAFHEASRVEALALVPSGTMTANDNAGRFTPPADSAGPDYRVLAATDEARPATSSVDIVVPLGDAVAAPVTGTVTKVTEYPLFGRVRDWRIEIVPEGRPDLTVVLVHLLRPSVATGDAVTAGQTSLGVARLLPFDSWVDRVLDERHPHTHIEVKPAVESEPLDPNAPAEPAGD